MFMDAYLKVKMHMESQKKSSVLIFLFQNVHNIYQKVLFLHYLFISINVNSFNVNKAEAKARA